MDPGSILNQDIVNLALDLVEASIKRLFLVVEPAMVWGPRYLVVVVIHPALKELVVQKFGSTNSWKEKWGAIENCEKIAVWKAETAQREGKPTSELTLMCPWDHESGDYLYPGGVVSGKLAVGVSGINGFGDEIAANNVLKTIEGLCKRKRELLREAKVSQLI
jgi:hypothetical protein